MKKWEYFDGNFFADQYNDTLLKYSPWSGHRRFGYDLVSYYEPENVVELGSFYGCSSFAFMQAVKTNHLQTKIYAIDLWEADDEFTMHDYEQDVFGFFMQVYESEFSDITVEIMKMSFDDALRCFDDCSIEILHIDGSHAYEDVRHDFETWLPKLKRDGIILFHDISEQLLYEKTLGSCVFWKELKEEYPYTAEMQQSWGLGILFLSEARYKDFISKVNLNYYLKMSTYDENEAKDRIRIDYFKLLDAGKWIESLKQDKEKADQGNTRLLYEIERIKKSYETTEKEKEKYINELLNTIQNYEKMVKAKEVYVQELVGTIDLFKKENKGIKSAYDKTIVAKDMYIDELGNTISAYEDTFIGKDRYIKELSATIDAYEQTIKTKDIYVDELKNVICEYEETVNGKERYIEELLSTIDSYKKSVNEIKNAYEQTIVGKDEYIEELLSTIDSYKKSVNEISQY